MVFIKGAASHEWLHAPFEQNGMERNAHLDEPILSCPALGFLPNERLDALVTSGLGTRGVVPAVVVLVPLLLAPLDPLRDLANPSLFNISLSIRSEREVSRLDGVGACIVVVEVGAAAAADMSMLVGVVVTLVELKAMLLLLERC